MEQTLLQDKVFTKIRSVLPPHLSLVAAVANALSISEDSAYRRIRGEKPLSLPEFEMLCHGFQLSADTLMHLHSGNFLFSGQLVEEGSFRLDEWETNLAKQIANLTKGSELHVYHIARDIPLLHLLAFPQLAAFKHHFWRRCVLQSEEYHNLKFSASGISQQTTSISRDLAMAYALVPSTEVWSPGVLSALLMQIDFYRSEELFENGQDSTLLYAELEALVNHMQLQAEYGYKIAFGMQSPGKGPAFHLYVNELQIGDETLVAASSEGIVSFLNHTFINYLYTYDERFGKYLLMMARRIISRSTPISWTGEKERNVFFESLRTAINKARQAPQKSDMNML